jgi:sarcosine oxidase, subunit gamma
MAERSPAPLAVHSPLAAARFPEGQGFRLEPWPIACAALVPWRPDRDAETARALGFARLPEMLRAEARGGSALLRLGPEELLALHEMPMAGAGNVGFSTPEGIEISHGIVGLRLSGRDCEAILACGCPLDLDLRAFPVGMATRTLFGKFDLTLWRRAGDDFRLLIARSAAIAFVQYVDGLAGLAVPGR